MSLSTYLQQPEFLKSLAGFGFKNLQQAVMDRGLEWFNAHPEEQAVIGRNLAGFNLSATDNLINRIEQHILFHYCEKLMPLCSDPAHYRMHIIDHVDSRQAIAALNTYKAAGKSVILATAHFGAVELIAPTLSAQHLPVAPVLRFTTPQFSAVIKDLAKKLTAGATFGPIKFIEIGDPNTAAAMEMVAALRRKDLLITIFDEKTEYSVPVILFGRKVWGGAGLDRLVKFSGVQPVLCAAFMIRTGNDTCRLVIEEIPDASIQALYDHLARHLKDHIEQWYFLHEEIPFAEN